MNAMPDYEIDHLAENGDLYDVMETCDDLRLKLSRLRRLHLMNEEEFLASREIVEEVRYLVETHVDDRP